MKEFTKLWTTTRPGLHYFMVSDNLRIHTNDSIMKNARTQGIHMFNIILDSSHWFQIHDQVPFETLKNKMTQFKDEILNCSRLNQRKEPSH